MVQEKADLERRVVQLETGMKRVDRAVVQLLELVRAVGRLTIGLVSALISATDIRLTDGTEAELGSSADDLTRRLRLDDDGDADEK